MQVPLPLSQFVLGLRLCLQGCYYAIITPQVWKKHKECYLILLSVILCLYLVCFILYIPVYISIFLVSYFINVEQWIGDTSPQYQAVQLFTGISLYIPLIIVFVTQYLIPSFSDDVFFATLNTLSPVKSEIYQATPAPGFWATWFRRIRRFLRLLALSGAAYLLSLVPYVGWIILPLTQFYLVSKIFDYKSAAIYTIILHLFPTLRIYSWPLAKLLIGARALSIETLDPYLSRFGYAKLRTGVEWPVLIGFSVPFVVLMSVPVVGPLCWGLVQASSAVLLLSTKL